MTERLILKWGTLKGWDHLSEKSQEPLQRYLDGGLSKGGAMFQEDTAEQKQALCDLIDTVDGEIVSDWTGETLTKDAAKKYVLEYRA